MDPAYIMKRGAKKGKHANHTPGVGQVKQITQEEDGRHRVEIRHGEDKKPSPGPSVGYPDYAATSSVYAHPDDLKHLKVGQKVRIHVKPHQKNDADADDR